MKIRGYLYIMLFVISQSALSGLENPGNGDIKAGIGVIRGWACEANEVSIRIQGGDPTGTGRGGPGYRFRDELGHSKSAYKRGTLAMANSGPNTNGSQFFIMHADYGLPNQYSIFGEVTEGIEVVDAIAAAATGPQDRPVQPVTINSVTITEV